MSSLSPAVLAGQPPLAQNPQPWLVASIKMLLLSRGPGRETNSLGSKSPSQTAALFRKVIEPQAAASFCTRYITKKQRRSSIHSSPSPCGSESGLVERDIAVYSQRGQRWMSDSGVLCGNFPHIPLFSIRVLIIPHASHISIPDCFYLSDAQLSGTHISKSTHHLSFELLSHKKIFAND